MILFIESDLKGLAAYTQWQDEAIAGPSYKFYDFWVDSSRITKVTERVKLPKDMSEEEVKERLEEWAEWAYGPMWSFTEALISYGYEEVK